jgi:flavin-dependent dehydrogenase
VGVGGWRRIGPSLRERLGALCRYLGLDEGRLTGLRGYHLPMRSGREPAARGPVLLAGDAAGLVDPLSGEGIHGAFVSGRLAAESIARLLSGEEDGLASYQRALERELVPEIELSWKLHAVFQRLPRPCVAVMRRSDRFWGALCGFVRGEQSYSALRRRLGPFAFALDGLARLGPVERG